MNTFFSVEEIPSAQAPGCMFPILELLRLLLTDSPSLHLQPDEKFQLLFERSPRRPGKFQTLYCALNCTSGSFQALITLRGTPCPGLGVAP